jgi:hypothetical protein
MIRRSERVHFALGILGLESDFEDLEMDDDKNT